MARVRVNQYVIEALVPTDAFSPTEVTGAGVSQYLIEVLGDFPGKARVSQYVVEVLMTEDETQSVPPEPCEPGEGGGVRVFGYAG
jgi:hypothetical protein